MNSKRNIRIEGAKSRPLLLDVFYPERETPAPLVLFCHGFKGFKDWGCWDLVARYFVAEGFSFVKFNFSHNGTTPDNPLEFDDLEAFGNNNFTLEMYDLQRVLDWATAPEQVEQYGIDPQQVYVIGHSRGGGIAILMAAEEERIKKVATWASVGSFERYEYAPMLKEWQEKGVLYIANSRTGQQMPLYWQLHEDLVKNKERLDIEKAAGNLEAPLLIVHGTADEAVNFSEAEALHRRHKQSELFLLQGANHVFGGAHPWEKNELPDDLFKVVEKTARFFLK